MVDANKLLKRRDSSRVFAEVEAETKPKLDIGRLVRRRNKAKTDLDLWRSLLETAYHYAVPNYNPFENYGRGGAVTPGERYNDDIYDLTLPIAHQRLADKMLMGLVPQGQQWMKFKPGDDFGDPSEDLYKAAAEATQKMTDQFFKILDRSNFYLAVGESLSDVLISTGVLVINEGNRKSPLKFEAAPASHMMFEGNAEGGIDACFRDWYDVRVGNIKQLWPDAKVEELRKDQDEKVNLWECSYIDHEAKPAERYKYVVMTTSKVVLLEQAHPSWPWVIYRMRKLTGEVRGRGPSLVAQPTAATINEALGDELTAAAYVANPMYMAASDSALNQDTLNARPGSIVPVQMVQGSWPIQAFPGGGNIAFSNLLVNDFRQQINEMMFAFPLGGVSAPDRTATEAQIRYTENLESFAAMVPRLQTEFFTPVIERCLWIINKVVPETFAGIDPDIRQKLISLDGQLIDVSFETPRMTERGQVKTQTILKFFDSLAAMVGAEAAATTLNLPNVVQNIANNSGVDPSNIKSKEEVINMIQNAGNIANQSLEQQGIDVNEEPAVE